MTCIRFLIFHSLLLPLSYAYEFSLGFKYTLLDLDLGMKFLEGDDLANVGKVILEC